MVPIPFETIFHIISLYLLLSWLSAITSYSLNPSASTILGKKSQYSFILPYQTIPQGRDSFWFLYHLIGGAALCYQRTLEALQFLVLRKTKCVSRSVMPDSLRPHGLQPTRLLCPGDFPDKDTGVGCRFLLQGIFPTQGSNLGLLHCRQILYRLNYEVPGHKSSIMFYYFQISAIKIPKEQIGLTFILIKEKTHTPLPVLKKKKNFSL